MRGQFAGTAHLFAIHVSSLQEIQHWTLTMYLLGECMALWGKPYEPSIQHHVYIFMQYVDS